MKANDTVMSKGLQEVYGCVQPQHIAGLEWQAEISFKAGIKEVVDDIVNAMDTSKIGYTIATVEKCLEKWEAKLKEWG